MTWAGEPGSFQRWMLTDNSHHLWRAALPESLPVGAHVLAITATDRHGRTFTDTLPFEVVDTLPNPKLAGETF